MPLGLLAAVIVLAADQASKWWVLNVLDLRGLRQVVLLPVLNLTMVWNRGVTFGLLNGFGSWGHIGTRRDRAWRGRRAGHLAVASREPVDRRGDRSDRRGCGRERDRSAAVRGGGRLHPRPRRYSVGRSFLVCLQCRRCRNRLRCFGIDHRLVGIEQTAEPLGLIAIYDGTLPVASRSEITVSPVSRRCSVLPDGRALPGASRCRRHRANTRSHGLSRCQTEIGYWCRLPSPSCALPPRSSDG